MISCLKDIMTRFFLNIYSIQRKLFLNLIKMLKSKINQKYKNYKNIRYGTIKIMKYKITRL